MSDEQPRKKIKRDVTDDVLENAINSISSASNFQSEEYSNEEDPNQDTYQEHSEESNKPDLVITGTEESQCDEKNEANAVGASSHCEIIAEHYNTLEEKGFRARGDSRIFHMRNFNNWIKSAIISRFLKKIKEDKKEKGLDKNIYVLDMGCGKGGDLFKWKDGDVTHVIFADLAETSVEQCKMRYRELRNKMQRDRRQAKLFTAEFISADCTRAHLCELYKDPSIKLDLVSCQFVFHYCWESLPQAECMLKNASECLRIGGYFLGTCPNASTIMSRLRKAGGKSFGNSVYSVTFEHEYPEDSTPPLFGAKYHFKLDNVVNCPEFLVHYTTFRKLAQRWGFIPCIKQPFRTFYESCLKEEELAKLLPKMTALEAYPRRGHSNLDDDEEEYSHARKVYESLRKSDPDGNHCLGTLSKSEWEAVTLYMVFAFKKIREPDLDF